MTEQAQLTPFQQQYKDAELKYKVTEIGGSAKGVYVSAEAGTGSRYAVVVSPMPHPGGDREGGQHLISLLQPWQGNMVFTAYPGEEIDPSYVMEKLVPRERSVATVHGGDAAGIVITVNTAARLFINCLTKERRALDELMGVETK
jgi:hypothetical protein